MSQFPPRRRPGATEFARQLRKADNEPEAMMWSELKARRLSGYKFVRHFPVGPYFADFLCREHRLVIELDGSQHSGSQHDARRDSFMVSAGYSVLRFWSTDMFKARDSVLKTILAVLEGRLAESVNADFKHIPAQKAPLRSSGPPLPASGAR